MVEVNFTDTFIYKIILSTMMLSGYNVRISDYIKKHRGDLIAFSVAIIFSVIFSIFSIRQYYSLGTSAFDLGINAQELYSFIHTGSFYTPLLNENALSQHFTIFKFLQLPFYYIFPSPITIMVLENIFIAMAGYIVYLLSMTLLKDHIKSVRILFLLSIGFLLSYEFSPFSESLVSFPFHNMAFLPFFFLLAFYAFLTERRVLHIVSIVFIISLHANFVYIAAILLLYEFLFIHTFRGERIGTWLSRKTGPGGIRNFAYFIIFVGLLYGYLVLSGIMKLHLAGISSVSVLPTTGETGTPAGSPIGLIFLLFEKPGEFISIIWSNHGYKIFFFNLLFKSNLYLPLSSPLSLILSLPYVMYAMPSSTASYYQLGYQYSAMVLGAIYISAILGLYNLLRLSKYIFTHLKTVPVSIRHILRIRLFKEITGISIVTVLIAIILVISIPYGILSTPDIQNTSHGSVMNNIYKEVPDGSAVFLMNLSESLSPNSYILTENTLMPYFSNFLHIYASPFTPGYYNNVSKYQYIIIQNNSFWARQGGNHSLQNIVNTGIQNGEFKLIKEYKPGNIMVFKNTV